MGLTSRRSRRVARAGSSAVAARIAAVVDAAPCRSAVDAGVADAGYSCSLLRVYLSVADDLDYVSEVEARALVDQAQKVRRGVAALSELLHAAPPTETSVAVTNGSL